MRHNKGITTFLTMVGGQTEHSRSNFPISPSNWDGLKSCLKDIFNAHRSAVGAHNSIELIHWGSKQTWQHLVNIHSDKNKPMIDLGQFDESFSENFPPGSQDSNFSWLLVGNCQNSIDYTTYS